MQRIQHRTYRSPQRDEQAATTRAAILAAFAAQLGRPGAVELSVAAAAATAGVAVRTIHHHFPDLASRLTAVAGYADDELGPLPPIAGVADLPDHVRRVHRRADARPDLARALHVAARADAPRARRRRGRHPEIAALLTGIGAPSEPTARAIAAVCVLADGDILVPLVDAHGLGVLEAGEAAAQAVAAIVADLRARRPATE